MQESAFPANAKASLTSCGQSQHGNELPFQNLGSLTQETILLPRAYIFLGDGCDNLMTSKYPERKDTNVHTKYFWQGMTRS